MNVTIMGHTLQLVLTDALAVVINIVIVVVAAVVMVGVLHVGLLVLADVALLLDKKRKPAPFLFKWIIGFRYRSILIIAKIFRLLELIH